MVRPALLELSCVQAREDKMFCWVLFTNHQQSTNLQCTNSTLQDGTIYRMGRSSVNALKVDFLETFCSLEIVCLLMYICNKHPNMIIIYFNLPG